MESFSSSSRPSSSRTIKIFQSQPGQVANLLPYPFTLIRGQDRGASVVRLDVNSAIAATGFFVSQPVSINTETGKVTLIMTNHHVLPHRNFKGKAYLNYENATEGPDEIAGVHLNSLPHYDLRPDLFYLSNQDLDVAIVGAVAPQPSSAMGPTAVAKQLELHTNGNKHWISLTHSYSRKLAESPRELYAPQLFIIGHPFGKLKKLIMHGGSDPLTVVNETLVQYQNPREAGSSGSPVFDSNWRLIALHSGGRLRRKGTAAESAIINDSNVLEHEINFYDYLYNEGVLMHRIIDFLINQAKTWVEAQQASVWEKSMLMLLLLALCWKEHDLVKSVPALANYLATSPAIAALGMR